MMSQFEEQILQRPRRLFRFFTPPNVNLFTTGRMWLSVANDFNDIFELAPRYDIMIERTWMEGLDRSYQTTPDDFRESIPLSAYVERMLGDNQESIIAKLHAAPQKVRDDASKEYGIVCFCGKLECVLMWGHYTNNHKGFAVEFDPQHPIFNPSVFGKVSYRGERPTIEDDDYRRLLLQKSPHWEYEDEYRLCVELKDFPCDFRSDKDTEKRAYLNLDFKAVKAVYFGIDMDPRQREAVLAVLKSENLKHIEAFIMRRHRKEYEVVAMPWKNLSQPKMGGVKNFDELWAKFGV
jgi:hypothetical protein